MKRNILLSLIGIISLSSCANQDKRYNPEDYILTFDYKEDFRVLQLSDTHIANKDNRKVHYDFMQETINMTSPDMIVITGDLFTFADKTVAKEYFDFFDKQGVPWTVTFGNHDEQCYFSIDWVTKYLNNYSSNCLFKDIQDDDVRGNANFAINLMDGNKIQEQLIIIDSNRYNYGEKGYVGYDYIRQDQIDWYERLVKYTTAQNGGTPVTSTAFYHIPVPEFGEAYNLAISGSSEAVLDYAEGELQEPVSCPKYNSGFFDKAVELGSTRAMCVGHDHINNARMLYKGIYLSYGIHSTNRIYYDEDLMGGLVLTYKADHSIEFTPYYHKYQEGK